MQIKKAQLGTFQRMESLFLWVYDLEPRPLNPDPATGAANVIIPLAAITERRTREAIPPCAACGGKTEQVTVDGHEVTVSTCTCLTCECCHTALAVLMAEHYVRLNPDKHDQIAVPLAKRLAQIGGIPDRTWCEQCNAIEPVGAHEQPQTVDLSGLKVP